MARRDATLAWDRFWSRPRPVDQVYPSISDVVAELESVCRVRGKRVLEVGAGTGRDSLRLAALGAAAFGLDRSQAAAGIMRSLSPRGQVRVIRADALETPFRSGSFDIVFHQGLLEHMDEPQRLLSENGRLLKPGGILLVDVPQKFHAYTLLKQSLLALGLWFAGREREFTIQGLRRLVGQAGFKLIKVYGAWMRPGLSWRLLREVLLGLRLRVLPLEPPVSIIPRGLQEAIGERARRSRWALYTFATIGAIGLRPNDPRESQEP